MSNDALSYVKEEYSFEDLVAVMAFLRGENGCSWDRAQDHRSIRKNLIEEAYEAAEGIDREDAALLCEELGDLLLQVVFHAQIAAEKGEFTIEDVINGICRKMVRRHPHVFTNDSAGTPEEAYARWEEVKKREKGTRSAGEALERVAKTLPSLMRTQKLLSKACKAGFETPGAEPGTKEELLHDYFSLCARANALGLDLEEEAYAENERYVERIKNSETEKNGGGA